MAELPDWVFREQPPLAFTFCLHLGNGVGRCRVCGERRGDGGDGSVCGWCLSPWAMGQEQDLRACPQTRDGWQYDCTQASKLYYQPLHAAVPLEKSLDLFPSLCPTSSTWLILQLPPGAVSSSSKHSTLPASRVCLRLSVQGRPRCLWLAHGHSGIGNAGPACARNWPENILKKENCISKA